MAKAKRIWRESQHPRDAKGRFSKRGGAAWIKRAATELTSAADAGSTRSASGRPQISRSAKAGAVLQAHAAGGRPSAVRVPQAVKTPAPTVNTARFMAPDAPAAPAAPKKRLPRPAPGLAALRAQRAEEQAPQMAAMVAARTAPEGAPVPGAADYASMRQHTLVSLARQAGVPHRNRSRTDIANDLAAKDAKVAADRKAKLNPSAIGAREAQQARVQAATRERVAADVAETDRQLAAMRQSEPAAAQVVAKLKARVDALTDRRDAARERRKNSGARVQSPAESKAEAQLEEARTALRAAQAPQRVDTPRDSRNDGGMTSTTPLDRKTAAVLAKLEKGGDRGVYPNDLPADVRRDIIGGQGLAEVRGTNDIGNPAKIHLTDKGRAALAAHRGEGVPAAPAPRTPTTNRKQIPRDTKAAVMARNGAAVDGVDMTDPDRWGRGDARTRFADAAQRESYGYGGQSTLTDDERNAMRDAVTAFQAVPSWETQRMDAAARRIQRFRDLDKRRKADFVTSRKRMADAARAVGSVDREEAAKEHVKQLKKAHKIPGDAVLKKMPAGQRGLAESIIFDAKNAARARAAAENNRRNGEIVRVELARNDLDPRTRAEVEKLLRSVEGGATIEGADRMDAEINARLAAWDAVRAAVAEGGAPGKGDYNYEVMPGNGLSREQADALTVLGREDGPALADRAAAILRGRGAPPKADAAQVAAPARGRITPDAKRGALARVDTSRVKSQNGGEGTSPTTEATMARTAASTGIPQLGVTTSSRGRTTTVTLPDGSTAQRTSKTMEYSHAVVATHDLHAEARDWRARAETERRHADAYEAWINAGANLDDLVAVPDGSGSVRDDRMGLVNYNHYLPGFEARPNGRYRTGGTRYENQPGAFAIASSQRHRSGGAFTYSDYEGYQNHPKRLAEARESRERNLARAAELEAGPQREYYVARWSQRVDTAHAAIGSPGVNAPNTTYQVIGVGGVAKDNGKPVKKVPTAEEKAAALEAKKAAERVAAEQRKQDFFDRAIKGVTAALANPRTEPGTNSDPNWHLGFTEAGLVSLAKHLGVKVPRREKTSHGTPKEHDLGVLRKLIIDAIRARSAEGKA